MSAERLPRGVWALGFVSLLMDLSSEMIHGLLPVFMVVGLGLSALSVGLVEGIAEATASVLKLYSGALSDRLGKRKSLALLGYGLAAATKPLFPLANGIGLILLARFVDRVGKGIRGAPRDALVADLTSASQRGAAYGLRQSLDTVGAVLGPLVAMALMLATDGDFRAVFWWAAVPAVACVALLAFGVSEPAKAAPLPRGAKLVSFEGLGQAFWIMMAIAFVLSLARFSEAFLLLRLKDNGLDVAYVPLGLVAMNVVYAATAYPMGRLSDRVGRRGLLSAGLAVAVLANLWLAQAQTVAAAFLGAALWGLQMGMTQGLLAAMVADAAPPEKRGTAFGTYHLLSGIALFPASLLAGWLWQVYGPAATFQAGAAIVALAFLGTMLRR
jgi:MFS family permease